MTKDKDQAIQRLGVLHERYDMAHLEVQKMATVRELLRLVPLLPLPAALELRRQICDLIEQLKET